MGLSKRLHILLTCSLLLVVTITVNLLYSWSKVSNALARDEYSLAVNQQVFSLQQSIISQPVGQKSSQYEWQQLSRVLTELLQSELDFTPQQKTIQINLNIQSRGLETLFDQLYKAVKEQRDNAIITHLRQRLLAQIESIWADSYQLAMIAKSDISRTVKQQLLLVLLPLGLGLLLLTLSGFGFGRLIKQLSSVLREGIQSIRKGDYNEIKIDDRIKEFSDFVKQFNQMTEQLKRTTVTRNVLQQIVDERTAALKQISETDSLTQLPNRRALFERGNVEFARAKRHGSELSLLIVDADWFKQINDKYGHAVGDKVLFHISRLFTRHTREVDFVARYGGEEFVFILPSCSASSAIEKATNLQAQLAENPLKEAQTVINITVSIGVAAYAAECGSFEALLNLADVALYQAKEKGRNRIELASC